MNKHLGEIVDSIEHERRELLASVSDLAQRQMDFRPAEDAWSIGENLDHLHLSEQGVTKLIKLSLSKAAKSDAAARTDDPVRRRRISHAICEILRLNAPSALALVAD